MYLLQSGVLEAEKWTSHERALAGKVVAQMVEV
jgi:hypothetical protein